MSNKSIESEFKAMFEEAKKSDTFQVETAILKLTEDIYKFMKLKNINKTQLAENLGKSNSFVTKILNGTNNFTLSTIIKLSLALDVDFEFSFKENKNNYTVLKEDLIDTSFDSFKYNNWGNKLAEYKSDILDSEFMVLEDVS